MPPASEKKTPAPLSVRRLADLLGTSRSTVSRAFRGDASVRPELRARILAEAGRLGYEPDPLVSEVMTSFARRKPVDYRETVGVLWWPDRWAQSNIESSFANRLRAGLVAAVERHGCRLTHFVLREGGAAALARMLQARRIRGVLLTPPTEPGMAAPALDWAELSTVVIGRSLSAPSFHCVHHNHYAAMTRVLGRLRERGYRRPALVVLADLEERMQRAYTGAFLAHTAGPASHVVRMASRDRAGLEARLGEIEPDVVVADVEAWAAAWRRIPAAARPRGFVALDVERREGAVSGVHQNVERMAVWAADLLMQARFHNETGVPDEPVDLQTPGAWVEGETLPTMRAHG